MPDVTCPRCLDRGRIPGPTHWCLLCYGYQRISAERSAAYRLLPRDQYGDVSVTDCYRLTDTIR